MTTARKANAKGAKSGRVARTDRVKAKATRDSAKRADQVLVRLSAEEAAYLASVSPAGSRATYLRRLLARDKARRERQALANIFANAASDVTDADREERRMLLSGFAGHD